MGAAEPRTTGVTSLLGASLWYASKGHPVFPCRPGEKAPATRTGFKEATTDPDQIRRWWTQNPAYNIGLPTGHAFEVLDLDLPGWEVVDEATIDGLCPGDWIGLVATPRGGCHLYLPPTGAGNKQAMLPGIDYRGLGGFVVAPPSVTSDGTYVWKDPPRW